MVAVVVAEVRTLNPPAAVQSQASHSRPAPLHFALAPLVQGSAATLNAKLETLAHSGSCERDVGHIIAHAATRGL